MRGGTQWRAECPGEGSLSERNTEEGCSAEGLGAHTEVAVSTPGKVPLKDSGLRGGGGISPRGGLWRREGLPCRWRLLLGEGH